ncbi:RNA polymerase subunit sigma-70 [Microbulbifer sp. ZGT114]|nr:RNA polymerase subunit sigma-70 [Microbulbifer sp. ZGT114]
MNQFLASVQRRAFNMARMAVGCPDDALDIVQDAMLALVRHYGKRDRSEWRPLFFSILQNRITDWHRRHNRVSRWQLFNERFASADDEIADPGDLPDLNGERPEEAWASERRLVTIERALEQLPFRQQQAFLLRSVEGFSVAETARIMKCSEGSVKTHLSRALRALRNQLENEQ